MGQRLESNETLLFYPTYLSIVHTSYGIADNTIGSRYIHYSIMYFSRSFASF